MKNSSNLTKKYNKMQLAVGESDEEERGQPLQEGMKKINERNKILMVTDCND